MVWEFLADTFRPGDEILALNCRAKEDALFLTMLDVSVVSCDLSDHLSERGPGALFDGALSNLSGLNSVADLNRIARDLASVVIVGAPLIICLSSPFCFSETLWFLLHGKIRKAFRRSFAIATVKVGDCALKMRYPVLREVKKSFSPFFLMRSCTGIGVVVPPSYLEPVFCKCPRVLRLLRRIDQGISHLPVFRIIGDHMLLCFERVEG